MSLRLLLVLLLLVPLTVQAEDDPVLFTVGDMPVSRSEFVQSYLKNTSVSRAGRQTVADYLEKYIVYKLKVKAALDAHIDATASFRNEYAQCLDGQPAASNTLLVGYAASPTATSAEYEKLRKRAGNDGLICPAQILIHLPQKASLEEQRRAQQQIESVYRKLQQGADFGELARQYSQDEKSSAENGVMGWFTRGQLFKDIEEVVFGLRKGEMSQPFLSTIGYHIFLMADRKSLEDYETVRERLSAEVGQRLVHQQVGTARLTGQQLQQPQFVVAEDFQIPSDSQQREYYEGLLVYELGKLSVGRLAAEDEEALKYYFKKNKKKYRRKGFKPKDYTEVRDLVVADLQEEMDKHWVADLRKTYPVNVNKKILKTVSNYL